MVETVTDGISSEELAKREYEMLFDPNQIRVRVRVSWRNGVCLPDAKGKCEETAVFKVLTFGDNHVFEKVTAYEMSVDRGLGRVSTYDVNEYKRLMVKRNLLSWTLDVPIERQDGWMTPECYARVSRIPAPLMEAFIEGFESRAYPTKDEEETIIKQSLVLFSKNSRGVADACEAVSAFCTLGNFWEKFGVGRGVPIQEMPYREYLMLKIVIGKENDAMRVRTAPRKPMTRIMGPGGKLMPSRGIVMED